MSRRRGDQSVTKEVDDDVDPHLDRIHVLVHAPEFTDPAAMDVAGTEPRHDATGARLKESVGAVGNALQLGVSKVQSQRSRKLSSVRVDTIFLRREKKKKD